MLLAGQVCLFKINHIQKRYLILQKRSYFLTGYLNFRKYKAEARICEWLESCNFIISKKIIFCMGMDAKKYLGEDKDFLKEQIN